MSLYMVLFLRTAILILLLLPYFTIKEHKIRRISGLKYSQRHMYFGSKAHIFKKLSNDAPHLFITLSWIA